MRSSDDLCLICNENKSTQKGSHLMPAGLASPCDGGRSKEELYFIGETLNVYYGPDNTKNNNVIQDTERRTNYNVVDYIFCPDCEKKLATIENRIIPILSKINYSVYQNQIEKGVAPKGIPYKVLTTVDPSEVKLFFYTVILRLDLAQRLNYNAKTFTDGQFEQIRQILNENLSIDISEVTGNEDLLHQLPLTILTSENTGDKSNNYYSPHRVLNDPPLFVACEYLIFLHFNDTFNANNNFGLPNETFDSGLINSIAKIKIGYLSKEQWHNFLVKEFEFKAKAFQEVRIKELMKTGRSYQECGYLLHKRAKEIDDKKQIKGYGFSFDEAFKCYIEELRKAH